MTSENLTCAGCVSWCRGAPILASAIRRAVPTNDLGTCQKYPPIVFVTAGVPMTLYPETHGARHGCDDWVPTIEFEAEPGAPPPSPSGNIVPLRSVT